MILRYVYEICIWHGKSTSQLMACQYHFGLSLHIIPIFQRVAKVCKASLLVIIISAYIQFPFNLTCRFHFNPTNTAPNKQHQVFALLYTVCECDAFFTSFPTPTPLTYNCSLFLSSAASDACLHKSPHDCQPSTPWQPSSAQRNR